MSIQSEKINAQRGAFDSLPSKHWHRHLIGPVELEMLFKTEQKFEKLIELFVGYKWTDIDPLADFRPEDEKYINKQSLIKALNNLK